MIDFHKRNPVLAAALSLSLAGSAVCLAPAASAASSIRVIISYKAGGEGPAKAALTAARGAVKLDIADAEAVVAEIPPGELAALRANPHVEFVEEDVKRHMLSLAAPSSSPYLRGQLVPYGIKMVQADQLPDRYAASRMVCVIDSGYDLAHEDLAANTANGIYDSGTGNWFTDESHHGTHVAGTIAALNNRATGVVGVAPNGKLRLHIVKVFGADGWVYSSTLARAATQCARAGANVISMSLGGADPSKAEQRVFDRLARRGVLSVAAAGNDGTSALLYPAAYASVVMVGAVDANKDWAYFSQFNPKVELTAPGVSVLSTVPMGGGTAAELKVGSTVYRPGTLEGAPRASATAPLAAFGIGDVVDPRVAGKVCLIERGSIDFGTKVANCQASGGVGAVIYNILPGGFNGTLGTVVTIIPSVTASDTEGATLRGQLGKMATVTVKAVNYAYYDGTSMATPHVSAVAALVWSYFPGCDGSQIRASLAKSALDLGPAGRDDKFGHGLVQAKAAYRRIGALGCGN